MWLTGRAAGPPLGSFSGVTAVMERAARTLGELTRRAGRAVVLDGPALLGERAALSGLTRRGDQSCGGSSRLLRSADSWIAISLVRPADVELLPAWLGVAASADPWPAVAGAVSTRAGAEVVQSGAELGLAVARLGERRDDRAAVVAIRLGEAAPAPPGTRQRVVDLSSLWAGPLAGQLLAAAGMDVVKVESTKRPDGARQGPAAFNDLLNADKASVALDFSTREGVGALRRLLLSADVVIEASRPRALEQLGAGRGRDPGDRFDPGLAVDHRARAHRAPSTPCRLRRRCGGCRRPGRTGLTWRRCSVRTQSPTRPPGSSARRLWSSG